MERINKETGELSASGELASVSEDPQGDDGKVEGKEKGVQRGPRLLLRALREQLRDLGGVGPPAPERVHRDERDPATTHRDECLLKVLPLYIQVCESDIRAEGVELKGLAGLIADMVVSNIHSRLADRPAEEARYQVVEFFQSLDGQSENPGWLLLKSLSLLTADNNTEDGVSWMKTGLPAALVKCLYLLVCLPAQQDSTAREESFQQLLTQVLLQLCTQGASAESMVETQELQCLIISLTSLWDQTSAPWRHQASRVLGAISAAQTRNTVPNLLDKNCVRICIQNLLRIGTDVPGPALAEVALAVFGFVRDTYPVNPALFAAFDANDGYAALESVLKRCEAGVPADQFQPVEELLRFIASLTLLGKAELKVALCVSNPQPPGFKFDSPLIKGGGKAVVRNLPAFLLLHDSLVRSADPRLCCGVLRALRSVWEWDRANFFLLEWTTQSLAQLAGCVWRKAPAVHKLFFSLLEMVVFQLNYIPHETLRVVQSVLKQGLAGTLAEGGAGAEFGVTALSCYHRMTLRSGLVAEVLSDGGLLELLLGELRKRAKILRKAGVVPATRTGPQEQSSVEASERAFTTCMLKVVAALTLRSIRNTVSVRDLGMVPYIKIFLDEQQYRGPALSILEQLAEVNPEEFMSTAIGALCSSTPQELALKHDLLQSVLKVLESPNSWDAFRRAGGFTGLLSLVVDMEGALSPRPPPQWGGCTPGATQWVLDLLLVALHILALAVHLSPVNAHEFQAGGFYERLAEALLQLGCFRTPPKLLTPHSGDSPVQKTPAGDRGRPSEGGRSFHQFVELAEMTPAAAAPSSSPLGPASCTGPPPLPPSLRTCLRLLSYLDQFATGTYATAAPELSSMMGGDPGGGEEEEEEEEEEEKPSGGREQRVEGGADAGSSVARHRADSTSAEDAKERSRNAAGSVSSVCSESRFTCDLTILHPGAVRVIMTLLPAVFTPEDPQLSTEVQFSVAQHVQALVKSERNRQIMCGGEAGGLVATLLTHCKATLLAPDCPLHLPVTRILEKLASQAITPSELRRFLCLADPLMCSADKVEEDPSLRTTAADSNGMEADGSMEEEEEESSSVARRRTLKRSFSLLRPPASSSSSSSSSSSLPLHQIISLVSMTAPRNFRPHRLSSAPAFVEFDMSQSGYGCLVLPSLATVKGVNADSIPTGGVGGECRGFPPAAGLSYSCWFHIGRFSSACDSHPIRLLSVVRHMSRAEHHYVCLSVCFSACDGCLVVSTEEEPFTFLDMMEPELSGSPSPLPSSLRFRCSSLLVPGQWHHLTVVLAKDVKKSCRVSAYLNGRTVGTAKMRYIQPFPGQCVSMDPTAVIDVYALIGTPSLWKEHAALLWRAGPAYLFEESLGPAAAAAIYAQGTAYLGNFLSPRHTGHEADMDPPLPARLVPEERISFGINPSVATVTTATQIREDYNEVDCRLIAKEMGITSRDNSTPVFLARNLAQHLSGTARTIGAALVGRYGVRSFIPQSAAAGFLYLGGPALTLSLVAMAADDSSLYAAMKVLVSVLETSPTMQREMNRIHGYKLLAFLLKMKNVLVSSRTFQLVLYMCSSLELLSGPRCLPSTPAFQALLCNLEVWQNTSENLDLSVLNHFSEMLTSSSGDSGTAAAMHSVGLLSKLLYQLCEPSVSMRKVHLTARIITHLLRAHFTTLDISRIGLFLVYTLPPAGEDESCGVSDSLHAEDSTVQSSDPASPVWTRNQLLLSLCDLLTSDDPLTPEQQKALFQTLGRDWFLLFLQGHLHPSTLRLALVLLTHLLARQSQQEGFREGLLPGTLVDGMDEPFVIMDNLRDDSWSYECLSSTCPGFHVLLELLVSQCHLAQVYGALAALLLGTTASTSAQGSLDSVLQSVIDSQAGGTAHKLCPEAAAILLELVRIIISRPIPSGRKMSVYDDDDASWEVQFPGSVMQFLCLLHSLRPRDPLWASAEFLHTLAAVVYPLDPPLDPLDPLEPSQDGEEAEASLTGEEEEAEAGLTGEEEEEGSGSHPARKQVCDFMRILLMDSLLNLPANNNSTHPLLQLLEFSPGEASVEQQQSFQTELLEFLMDIIHMISLQNENNTHLNPQDCEGQMVVLMDNVALFSKTLVHRLYSGMLLADPHSLLTFLTDQIVVAVEKGQALREKTVSTLYSCTNKVLLYFLSHPRRSPAEQEVVTGTLRVVMARWDVVMATYNANVVFVTCLLHCLLMIRSGSYSEGFGCAVQRVNTRKISLSRLFPLKTPRSVPVSLAAHSATESELTSLAEACWSKVLAERRHALESHYKIEISANQTGGAGPVSMTDVSPLWEEMSYKAWQIYIESQRSKATGGAVKMAGDVISSALRSVQRRLGRESATVKEFLSCMESQRQRGHDMFENMRRNNMQLCSSAWERVSGQWLRVEADLLRERAVFGAGPGVEAPATRDWVQDAAEGPNRTRPRIRRRALRWSKQVPGSLCLCLRTGASEHNNRSGAEPEAETRILCEPGAEVKEVSEADETSDCECLTFFPVLSETPVASAAGEDPSAPSERPASPESCSRRPSCPDLQIILQELQPGEEVKCKVCVVVVSGLRVVEGLLLFGKESLYVCEGFTVNSAGDVCCRKHHPSSVRDSSISTMLSKEAVSASCKRWPYEEIKETRFIRFLLEDNALEIFARNGHSAFLVFLNKDHVSAYKRLCSVVPSLKGRGVAEVIANARKTPVVGKAALVKWQRGEMSNFEYLMHLNTLAGRTYNDLMQYPVFPWVLADYHSENLDLSNAATFRDLSKPMGAQTEKRRAMFLQRYEEVVNSAAEEGELSACCHYCTHYSSAIIVASFLVRMEPFSNTFLALQGGLDVPERMFHSVKKEWESASRDNMGDVRELIPEFYYLPDFLLNSNHIPLGSMQDGTTLGDVVLPPWAKGDPQEFIRVHREALESDHVSSHLHQWIDLIFGHRQQGAPAVESANTFHPYFYAPQKHRGAHDGPTDPLIRSTILGYVSNFGQVPKQLFTKPHPPRSGSRKDSSSPPHHVPFFFRLDKVKANGQLFKELPRGPVGQIVCLEKEMLVLERNRLLLSPLCSCYFGWGFPDSSCAFGNYATEKTFAVCEAPCDWGQTLCAATPDPSTLVTGGASGVVCVWDVAVGKDKLCHMKLRQPLYGHRGAVTCLAASEVHGVLASGSGDRTCILWDLDELAYVTQLAGHQTSVTALAINQLSGEIASCAGPLLYLWTMKGQLLARTDTSSCGPRGDVLCVAFSQKHEWDARNVIVTGCRDGLVRIWRTEYTRTQLPGPPEEPASPGRAEHPAQTERHVRGGCWERHLVLCRELNQSQSTSGRRFKTNPAITALAMSRSHATLLAGDAWGRVYIWTCE